MFIDWEDTILADEYFDYDGAVYGVETADEGPFKDCLFAWSSDGNFIVTRPLWYHWFTNRCNGADCVCVDICVAECASRAAKTLESSERDGILSDLQAYYDQFSATYQRSRSPEIFALFESDADVHSLKNPGYLSLCSSSSEDAIVPTHEDDSVFIATAGANDVGVINELCMSLGIHDVEYIFRVSGPPHIPKFSCTAISNTLGAIGVVTNMPNKKVAKQAAATAWLLNYRSNNMMPSSMIARGAVGDDIPVSVMGSANTPSMPIRAEVPAKVVNGALNDVPDLVPENQAICLHESSIYVPKPLEKVIITPMAKPKPKAFTRAKVVMLPISEVGFRRARAHGEFNVTRCVTASAYDSDDYSRLYAGSRAQPGFRLQLDTFWSPLTDEYLVQVWVGYNQAIGSTSPTAEGAFKDACKKAVRFCLVQGIPLPEKADVVDWTVPTTDLTGDAQFVQLFDNGATFFPAIVNNSGFDSPHAYMAIPGDHSKLWRGAGDIVKSVVNGKTIFGADVKSDLKITSDYSFLPVSLALGNVTLLPWTSIVMGNSWELAVWLLGRTKSVIPILLTGAINANGLSSGAVPLKNELARLSEWRSSDVYGQVRSSIIGPGAIIPAATLDAVKIPIENRNLIIDFRELVLNAMKRQDRPVVVTTVSRKYGAKKNNGNNNSNNRLPPAITKTTKVMTVPKGKQKNTETVQYVKYQQPNMMDMGSQLTSYVRALVDPFAVSSTGVKIPDTVTYPSNTYRLEMRQDITADASGNIAVALVPWHRATLQTSNVTNATNVYDWKSGSVLDYTQKAAIESQFSMARTVAGGIRVRYTGSALGVAGSITGAITDPGQAWPKSYTDVNNLPEFREYSASAESAGVEVIWKPMTIHQQPYHETTSYPTPAGGSTIFYPYGANANVGVVTRSSWQTADGTGVGPITLERNEYPFLIVAGKGFPAGAPFIVEVVLHFEVVQRLGTLQVGRSRPSAALANYSSMDQAANVLAQMPAVRKPDDGFIAKATKIVKGMAGLVRGGFEVVNEVKSGLVNVLN